MFNIIGSNRVVKSFDLQAILFIPLAGATVQFGHTVRLLLVQSLPQQISKEMVIAVPTPLVVQRDDEQVGAFEVLQGFLPGSRGGGRSAPLCRPVPTEQTTSQRGPHRRSRIDVRSKKV